MGHEIDVSTPEGLLEYEECQRYYRSIDERNGNTSSKYKTKKEREIYRAISKKINDTTKLKKNGSIK